MKWGKSESYMRITCFPDDPHLIFTDYDTQTAAAVPVHKYGAVMKSFS